MGTFKEESKRDFSPRPGEGPTIDQVQVGCLQRIADATERMATNFLELQRDVGMYKKWYNEEVARSQALSRKLNALRGVVTKLKKAHNASNP